MKKEKKLVIIVLVILLISICAWVSIVYLVDPFYHYHKPWLGLQAIATTSGQSYQITGIAKNFEYDSAIVGSSMTENFRASHFSEAFDCNAIKLSFQLGRMENYDQILKNVFEDRTVKNVFYGLDFNAIGKAPWQIARHQIPEYLSNNNIFDDVEYVLNKDVMFDYLLPYLKKNITNKIPDFDNSYLWGSKYVFSKEKVVKEYSQVRLKSIRPRSTVSNAELMQYASDNMKVITKYIEDNPNTTFYIFYPPFSILVFDDLILKNDFENCMDSIKYSIEELLKYDNVKLYLFQNMQDVITNIDLYKDTAHYNEEVNKLMLQYLKEDKYRITKDNYLQEFNDMKEFLKNYNYDSLFV